MRTDETYQWLLQSQRRCQCLQAFAQPMTVKQMARGLGSHPKSCGYLFWEFRVYGLATCLNEGARSSRIYALTPVGRSLRRRLLGRREQTPPWEGIDWELYGQMLFRHREAVIRALITPMRPPAIKKRARQLDPDIAISVGNVREVMYRLLAMGVVRRVQDQGDRYASYELTDIGRRFRQLMLSAAVGGR